MPLEIRTLRVEDESTLRQAQADLARENFPFAFGLDADPDEDFASYVDDLEARRDGRDVPEGWVPGTFLVAVDEGEIVGRVSVRHELNDFLASFGGHVGYAVTSTRRRRGIATALLAAGLEVLRELGVTRALLTCDHDSVGSATIIERSGGVFEGLIDGDADGIAKRRYWIEL